MWEGKWDNMQPVILTAGQLFEQHSVTLWLIPSVAAFLATPWQWTRDLPPKHAAADLGPAGCCWLPCLPPFCSPLSHPSAVRGINYSFPPLLPVIPNNFSLSVFHQSPARACPTPRPLQDDSGLLCEESHLTASGDTYFVFKHLRVLWLKDQPR